MKKTTLGFRFLAAVCAGGSLEELVKLGSMQGLFAEHEQPVYDFVREHAAKHGAVPQTITVQKHTGADLPDVNEPASYYLEQMRQRAVDLGLRDAIQAANEYLKPGPGKDPVAALEALTSELWKVQTTTAQETLYDLRDAREPVLSLYQQVASGQHRGIHLGWPSLDSQTGGVFGGDLVSFVGRPGQGKTFKMLYAADQARRQGKVALFLTMEMKHLDIQQRMAAMVAGVPGLQLKHGALSTHAYKQLKSGLTELKSSDTPLYILDGGLKMRVDRLHMICRQIQPDIVFVDGAYMLKHPDESLQKFRRIDAVCEQLKDVIAMDLDLPVVCSWQFNKQKKVAADKKGQDANLTMDDIYGSDTIAHMSSIILGLFEADSASTLRQRRIDGLKIRDAAPMRFHVAWDFHAMDFSEVPPPPPPENKQEEASYVD